MHGIRQGRRSSLSDVSHAQWPLRWSDFQVNIKENQRKTGETPFLFDLKIEYTLLLQQKAKQPNKNVPFTLQEEAYDRFARSALST
jgi:hypothetical protein